MKRRGKRIALLAGAGVLVVAALAGIYWEKLAAHYRFWRLFESIGPNEQGYPEYRHRQTGIIMVRVPGSSFSFGWPEATLLDRLQEYAALEGIDPQDHESLYDLLLSRAFLNFGPQILRREVRIDPFLIAKYEVPRHTWVRILSGLRSKYGTTLDEQGGLSSPGEYVEWSDIDAFCRETGLLPPTEDQWEYACLGVANDVTTVLEKADRIAWYQNEVEEIYQIQDVGLKEPNCFGLYDTIGNLLEWCVSCASQDHPKVTHCDGSCWTGSGQFLKQNERENGVLRGGSWDETRFSLDPRWRRRFLEGYPITVGFRPAYYPLP